MNITLKKAASMIIVLLVLLSAGISSAAAYSGGTGANNYSNFKQSAYDIGYSYGRADAQVRRNKDYKRYKNLYNGSTKNDFKRGYNLGYSENYGTNNGGNGGYGNGNGNGGYGNGGGYGSVPNWMIGTFRGYTSGNNTYTQITVTSNGYVTIAAENGSGNANGTYSNGFVSFPWGTYKFKKEGNGFRAVNTSNSSDRVLYRRY